MSLCLATSGIPFDTLFQAVAAGVIASLACGLGVLPLALRQFDPARQAGTGYAVASGLMIAASVFSLILPGLEMQIGNATRLSNLLPVIAGVLLGAFFLTLVERYLPAESSTDTDEEGGPFAPWGGRLGLLVFVAMAVHSLPEGVAVGVGYTSDKVLEGTGTLGTTLAIAIGIHNIPEGLAVAIPLRSRGLSLARCFAAAVLTSLPQPLAAIPAVLLAWFFQPLMPVLMGFAAGAMIYLVILELIPQALQNERPGRVAWSFLIGFCGMVIIQELLSH